MTCPTGVFGANDPYPTVLPSVNVKKSDPVKEDHQVSTDRQTDRQTERGGGERRRREEEGKMVLTPEGPIVRHVVRLRGERLYQGQLLWREVSFRC